MQVRILVVDDDAYIRQILAKYIQHLGFEVCEAESGSEALNILADTSMPPVDVVISDIWMPRMSGLELLQTVRQKRPDLPVALITGAATLDSSIAALNAGAYAYVTKPINSDQVHDVIMRGLVKRDELWASQILQHNLLSRYQELEQHLDHLQERDHDMRHIATDKYLAELISGLRHELGNATTAIKLNLSVLEDEGSNPANLQEHLRDLQDSTEHLVSLLAKLREYPKHQKTTELFDLREIIHSSTGKLRDSQRQNIQMNVVLPAHALHIQGAPLDLSRAFVHILENAVEASERNKESRIEVIAESQGETITITFNDYGPGFTEDMLEKPFSPGYTTKVIDGMVRGLGLGLFIARAVVELHEGQIWLENRPQGGASVHIQLPLARESAFAGK